MLLRRVSSSLWLLCQCTALVCSASATALTVNVSISNPSNQALTGVQVQLKIGSEVVASAETDREGHAEFTGLKPALYQITAVKDGFETLQKTDLDLSQGVSTSIELTLIPTLARRESIEVKGTVAAVDQGSSPPADLPAAAVKELPSRPATVADALPMIPGVVRTPGGGLQISAGGEHRSALIVNSADVTDPATGQFGLTVPIDSVETLNVFQTPFLAEYGRFTAGLVSVETRRGGEKWKWELNDPFPEFRIRSWQLRGLRDATPRLNVEGPLIPGKLYFSEGFEYAIRKVEVFTLPFPQNQKRTEGVNSFTQLDWIASDKQLVTATVHIAPQRRDGVNMNYFNPQATSPDESSHSYNATLADRLSLGGGLLENTLSITRSMPAYGAWDRRISRSPRGAIRATISPSRTAARRALRGRPPGPPPPLPAGELTTLR
jgi:hypothetical protein